MSHPRLRHIAFSILRWYSHDLTLTNAECREPCVVGPPVMWSIGRTYDVLRPLVLTGKGDEFSRCLRSPAGRALQSL
jgi:hypothetical protein